MPQQLGAELRANDLVTPPRLLRAPLCVYILWNPLGVEEAHNGGHSTHAGEEQRHALQNDNDTHDEPSSNLDRGGRSRNERFVCTALKKSR